MKSWAFGAMVVSMFAVAACGKGAATTGTTTGDTGGSGGASTTGSNTTGSSTTTGSNTTGSNTTTGSSTTSATTGTGGAASCGGLVWSKDATCQDCMTMSCCAELAACDTGMPCDALISCFNACTDKACQMKCQTDHADGVSDAQALGSCAKASCDGTSCSAGICTSGLTTNKPACDTCLGTNCCTEWTACTADAGCLACATKGAMDPGCTAMGKTLLMSASTCESGKCKAECM